MSLRARLIVIALVLVALGAAPALIAMSMAILKVSLLPDRLRLGWVVAALSAYAVGALALVVLADLLVRRTLRGLDDLTAALRTAAAGDAAPELRVGGPPEIAALAGAYNAMAERLAAARREADRAGDALVRGERLATVGRIAAGVAHDLRNPIAALVSYARLALEAAPAESPLRPDLERIAAEAGRAAEIVRALRDLAQPPRPETGRTDLSAVVRTAADLVRRSFRVPVEVHGADVHVEADAPMLREAFVNLLANAARAAAERGSDGRVEASVGREGRGAFVAVADNGPGIPAEIRARLFEPFVTASPEGTGLGLATARRVVESHGGRIEVETGPAGTTFRVILPRTVA